VQFREHASLFSATASLAVVAAALLAACADCGQRTSSTTTNAASAGAGSAASHPPLTPSADRAAPDNGAPRPGMVWIPPGSLRAGTPPAVVPRVADEEMPGVPVEMPGFYVDDLPWPNEPNAIPTTNVSRDEADQLCAGKGKRLCTELEWERACKGPSSSAYEYGDAYRKDVCGTGVAVEQAARRPTGEHAQCRSGFGVSEMHGGVFEWTSSAWGRGSRDASLGVLRGGNSVAGEIVGRCANAIARSPTKKAATMGLRCCAGTKSPPEVELDVQGTPGFALGRTPPGDSPWLAAVASALGTSSPILPKSVHAWSWIPVGNEALEVVVGCAAAPKACAVVVGRGGGSDAGVDVLATAPSGRDLPEVARVGDPRHLRMRALDTFGIFGRDITYQYGRVEVGDPKRR
jgi:formylglycine-generating enzyme required for sulfatase activity